MGLRIRNFLLLAKEEATYGTDPSPTGADDAILIEEPVLRFPAEVIDREAAAGSMSPVAPILGRNYAEFGFKAELKGSGAAGTAPDAGVLLKACGFKETVVASTSVTYTPSSDESDHKSVTLYFYMDGLLYEINGARGNVALALQVGQRAMMNFSFKGFSVAPVDASLPSPTLDSTKPVPIKGASFTLGGYAAVIANLNLDMQNQVEMTDDMNDSSGYEEAIILDRNPQGSLDPQNTLVATHNWWNDWQQGTEQALSMTLGATAGNIVTLTAPKIVDRELQPGDRQGLSIYEVPFTAAGSSGDDEVSIALT